VSVVTGGALARRHLRRERLHEALRNRRPGVFRVGLRVSASLRGAVELRGAARGLQSFRLSAPRAGRLHAGAAITAGGIQAASGPGSLPPQLVRAAAPSLRPQRRPAADADAQV
jgi:hypothetical protein